MRWSATAYMDIMPRMTQHLHIDPFSGIAGDMFLGAMVDLGVEVERIVEALAPLPVHGQYELTADRVQRLAIGAVDVKIRVTAQATQAHRHYGDLAKMIDLLATSDRGKQRARGVLDALAQAEGEVHGVPPEKVHFHEVGAVDSIVDMFGSMVALELLAVDTISCGPLPISRGFVRCDHGRMPVPAPATARLMRGMRTVGVDRQGELVTPTGAAIVAGVCQSFGPAPPMTLEHVGYGAGDRDDPDWPNLLRLFLGQRA